MPAGVKEIVRRAFDAQRLASEHPPRLHDRNKKLVYDIACPPGSVYAGEIQFSRWVAVGFPSATFEDGRPEVEVREDFFGYEPGGAGGNAVEWYLNFANFDLFSAYGGALFAQDEMQVAEHPALASLREALIADGVRPLAVESGQPTPALVTGVERRCRIATNPDESQGRPRGLYGNEFGHAAPDVVERATTPIVPPTRTNILAIEAPAGGSGRYMVNQIVFILRTAFAGFTAAGEETRRLVNRDDAPKVVIHTGFWGCGAYGGNRVLMALLQLVAAHLARVDRLVFHTGDSKGADVFREAERRCRESLRLGLQSVEAADLLACIESMGFGWGVSNGT
jgi:hypothetical protein